MKTCKYTLTATTVANSKPRLRPYKLTDGGGMYLWIAPSGAKSWRYDYKLFGVSRTFTIGAAPSVSLAEARSIHQKARNTVADGRHPLDLKKEQATARERETKNTFEHFALLWQQSRARGLAPGTARQISRELRKHVLPKLGKRPISQVLRADIAELIKGIETATPEVARNCRTHISAVFEFAVNSGAVGADPTPPKKILAARNPRSHLAAPASELGNILVSLSRGTHYRETEIAFRLVAMLLLRKSEVIEAEWSEIDFESGVWRVPKHRKKERRDFVVILPRQALLLLKELRQLSTGRLLFPNRDDDERPMANRSLNALLKRHGLASVTKVHGLRATASTYLNESNPQNSELVEYLLAHAVGTSVKRAYDRGDRETQRGALLQEWADHLEKLEQTALRNAALSG